MSTRFRLIWFWVLTALLTGCTTAVTPAVETPAAPPADELPAVGLPNPASVFCEERGYNLEMREGEGGTTGFCIFPDGSECEEWAFFRGECGPGGQTWGAEQLTVILLESFPVQVQVSVSGTLPDSCSRIERIEQAFDAQTMTFDLLPIVTATATTGCAATPVTFEQTVNLEVVGLPAGTYTVQLGILTERFTLAIDNVIPAEETDAQELPADISSWPEITNPTFGFSFRFPPDWTVTEEDNPVHTLYGHQMRAAPPGNDEIVFTVAFKEANDDRQLTRTGMREGEFVEAGMLDFLGEPVAKSRLVFEDRVMGVYYDGAGEIRREPLVFTLALDFLGDSRTGEGIPPEFEQLADLMVRSFAIDR